MRNKRSNKIKLFLLLLLVITVGYALLSQTLDINGTTNIKSSNWSIIWDNIQVKDGSVSGDAVTTAASITNTKKTLVEYSISLSEPGEFYEFTVDAKNEGTIDGMVNVVSNKIYESNGTTEKTLPEYLTYTVTYSDGKAIEPKHLLSAGSTEKYKVRVEFKDVAADKLPSQNETLKFKFEVEYVQADDSAQTVNHGLTGTRYTVNTHNDYQYVNIGQKPGDNITLYETAAAARAAFNNSSVWLKHNIEMDIVKESYACFEKNDETYCLQGGVEEEDKDTGNHPIYDRNKQILLSVFESSQCTEKYNNYSEYDNNGEGIPGTEISWNIRCSNGSEYVIAFAGGFVSTSSHTPNQTCRVNGDGTAYCGTV